MKFGKKIIALVLIILLAGSFVVGCGSSGSSQNQSQSQDNKQSVDKSKWPKGLSIGSSTIGGTVYLWMVGWGNIITKNLGIQTNVESTGGPVNNLQLVNNRDLDLAHTTMGPAYEAWTGTGWANGKKYQNVRGVFPMFVAYLHWWCMPQYNIKNVYDFEGKVVSNGPAGSSPDLYGKRVFEELGIHPQRIVTGQYGDLTEQMRDGLLVANASMGGVPNPTPAEMVTTDNVNIIGVPAADAEKIAKKYGITTGVIPANTYKNQTEDIPTLTMWNEVIAHKDVPADLVYELVKTTFANIDELIKVHPTAKEVKLENVKFVTSIPLHPGAIKYYEEKGIELPPSAYPPEYKK